MRLILVRHGETDLNKAGVIPGCADVELNATGLWQARQAAAALRHEPVAAVYSSPFLRALATAQAIASEHRLSVAVDEGLREWDIGAASGLPADQARRLYPHLWQARPDVVGPAEASGEPLWQVGERAWASIQRIRDRHRDETVVAVTHMAAALCLACRVLGIDLSDYHRLRHNVAGITSFELSDDRNIILRLNDTCHLGPPAGRASHQKRY